MTHARGRTTRARIAATGALAALLALSAADPVVAHNAGNSDEHGTMHLLFGMTDGMCRLDVVIRHVDNQTATFQIEERPLKANPEVVHEATLEGVRESDGEGFRFEAGPFEFDPERMADPDERFRDPDELKLHRFVLRWHDGGEHMLELDWQAYECAADPLLLAHQDERSGAVLEVEGCSFFLEGRHIRHEQGNISILDIETREGFEVEVTSDDTAPEEQGVGFRFFVGPVDVERASRYDMRFLPFENGTLAHLSLPVVRCEAQEDPTSECPSVTLAAVANDDETVTVTAAGLNGSAELLRAAPGGDFEPVATLEGGEDGFQDTGTEAGVAYTYRLMAGGEVCDEIVVTAIPVFAGLAGVAAALGTALVGYAFLRRRQ